MIARLRAAAQPTGELDDLLVDDVDRQLIIVARRLYVPSIGGAVIIAPLIAALAWDADRAVVLVAWAAVTMLAGAIQAWLMLSAETWQEQRSAEAWMSANTALQPVIGLLLGVSPALFEGSTTADPGAVVATLIAVSTGAIVTFAPLPGAARALLVPMWVLATAILVIQDEWLLAVGGAVFLVVALSINEGAHRVIRDSIEHRIEASRLAGRVRSTEATASAVIQTAGEAIWMLDTRGTVVTANPAARTLVGGDVVGRPLSTILPELRIGEATGSREAVLHRADGPQRTVILAIGEIPGAGYTVTATDISDLKMLERRLDHEATHDALTGLPNRAGLLRRLSTLRGASRTGALLFIDLDGFKAINDSLGHAAGDQLLRSVGARLRQVAREVDVVARLGGDEFVLLLADADADEARTASRRLIDAIERPHMLAGRDVRLSCSVGLAVDDGSHSGVALLAQADTAMYEAKERGRAQVVVFDMTMRADLEDRMQLRNDLMGAIANGEMVFEGEPLVDLATGEVLGVELLARWQHPVRGRLAPGEFIGLAAELDLVIDLGRLALDEAASFARSLPTEHHPDLQVGVNISLGHVLSGSLAEDILLAARRHEIDPGILVVELTETELAAELAGAAAELRRVRELGVGVAIDDFGTGYSSLSYLHSLPATAIKLDPDFILGVLDDARRLAVIRSVVGLASELGLAVVAEGIEQEAVGTLLEELGVKLGQGYVYTRSLPLDEMLRAVVGRTWVTSPEGRTMGAGS
ncbi:MAG: EAL domain-containing protein [Actinomycetota bacterium]